MAISVTTPANTIIEVEIGGILGMQTPAEWGSITGTLSDQEDLAAALALKAPLASPTFTGTVTAATHKAASTAGIEVLNSANVSLLRIGKYNATTGYSTGIAAGFDTTASGEASHSEGDSTTASGDYSHAEGDSTTASGYASHAEGGSTLASGDYTHAEGGNTLASGDYSHAEGDNTTSGPGHYTHAAGRRAKATLLGSRVMTDSQDADCTSLATDSCTFRYQNGYRFLGGAADFAVTPTVAGVEIGSTAAIITALGLTTKANLATANTDLAIGTLFYNTALSKLDITTA